MRTLASLLLFYFISFFSSVHAQDIVNQDFDELNTIQEFQSRNPDIGQVDAIRLNLDDGREVFSLGGSDGSDKFLNIDKYALKRNHFDRFTDIEDAKFLKLSFNFSVISAGTDSSKFAAFIIGDNLGTTGVYPPKSERWAQIGIYVNKNNTFSLANETIGGDENNNGTSGISGRSGPFGGDQKVSIFMNNSDNLQTLVYYGPNNEYTFIPSGLVHVWVGDVLKIQQAAYKGGSSALNAVKFLVWGTALEATARLDELIITEEVEVIPIEEFNPLPVELTAFTAEKLGNDVVLDWETASEKNSSHFDVERSLDGNTYRKIGTLSAAGNSTSTLNYTFTDKIAALKFAGTVFYRLHQVDFDGASEYSPVNRVELPAPVSAVRRVFPNPFSGDLNIGLLTEKSMEMNFRLLDLQGTTVARDVQIIEPAGQEQVFRFSGTESLQSGMYILEVGSAGEKKRYRLVKL